MADQDLRSIVLSCLQSVAPEASFAQLDPAVSFHEQFDIDSVDYLNFVLKVEEALGIRISESDYPKLSNLDGCLAVVREMVESQGGESIR
jgi:Acyl carrier protein